MGQGAVDHEARAARAEPLGVLRGAVPDGIARNIVVDRRRVKLFEHVHEDARPCRDGSAGALMERDPALRWIHRESARRGYGCRSSDALPLATSKGTDMCSCVIIHLPSYLR